MKKLMLLLLATLLITASCSGRKVLKNKETSTVKITDKTETKTESVKSLRDSVRLKVFTNETNETLSTSWEYEAPTKADTVKYAPLWVRIGSDSVDVTKLPVGSKIRNIKTEAKANVVITKDEKRNVTIDIKDTTTQRNDVSVDAKDEKNKKEVEKESLRWLMIVGGFAVGWFLVYVVKIIYKTLKNQYGIK